MTLKEKKKQTTTMEKIGAGSHSKRSLWLLMQYLKGSILEPEVRSYEDHFQLACTPIRLCLSQQLIIIVIIILLLQFTYYHYSQAIWSSEPDYKNQSNSKTNSFEKSKERKEKETLRLHPGGGCS